MMLSQEIVAAVEGDLESFQSLLTQSPAAIDGLSTSLPELILARKGLLRVLLSFQKQEASAELIQAWASFMRHGYFGSLTGKRTPIHIEYDSRFEDQIVEVIARLDELGDIIDGTISDEELAEMIQAMQ